jgi:2-polyprenyl-3-methyl-5-hydroxy-6-metoxy-1,4-benzoquinol methylase
MKAYYDDYWRQGLVGVSPDGMHGHNDRSRLLWSLAPPDAESLLDCGSGEGRLVWEGSQRGLRSVGMELSAVAVGSARRNYPRSEFIEHSVEDRPWPVATSSFDLVVAFEVIEHLLQPDALIAGAADALKPDGHLALTTPYHGLLKNLALVTLGFERHFDPEGAHIRFFTDQYLRTICMRHGLIVDRISHYGRVPLLWEGVFVWARLARGASE